MNGFPRGGAAGCRCVTLSESHYSTDSIFSVIYSIESLRSKLIENYIDKQRKLTADWSITKVSSVTLIENYIDIDILQCKRVSPSTTQV